MLMPGQALRAQKFFGSFMLGGSNYQGEMQEFIFDFKGMRPASAFGIHYAPNAFLSFQAEFMVGKLSGRDALNSMNQSNRVRNLSFESGLQELSILARFNLLNSNRIPVVPYGTGGVAVFRVDPFTTDGEGNKVFLYPLSTEGQGLPQYPKRHVQNRVRLSLPFGPGLEVRLTKYLRIDLEVLFRKTFTDYIDDVSSEYPDEAILLAARGPKAVELSWRGDEVAGGNPNFPAAGSQRGNPLHMDWYHSFNVRLRLSNPEWDWKIERKKVKAKTGCWKK
jgi:hypothetical protein